MTREQLMAQHLAWAHWWMHAASNGHAATRTIHKGALDGPLMTPDELRDEAMETAKHHIHRYVELGETP